MCGVLSMSLSFQLFFEIDFIEYWFKILCFQRLSIIFAQFILYAWTLSNDGLMHKRCLIYIYIYTHIQYTGHAYVSRTDGERVSEFYRCILVLWHVCRIQKGQGIWVGRALPLCWPLSPGWLFWSGSVAPSSLPTQCRSSIIRKHKDRRKEFGCCHYQDLRDNMQLFFFSPHLLTWDPDVTLRPLSALICDFFSSASATWGRCCFAPSDPAGHTWLSAGRREQNLHDLLTSRSRLTQSHHHHHHSTATLTLQPSKSAKASISTRHHTGDTAKQTGEHYLTRGMKWYRRL